MARFVFTRDAEKLLEHRMREQGYDDGYARRPAVHSLLVYQRSYLRGVAARNAEDEADERASYADDERYRLRTSDE